MRKIIIGHSIFATLTALAIIGAASITFAQDYGQVIINQPQFNAEPPTSEIINPYDAKLDVPGVENNSGIDVENKQDTIKAPESVDTNPTGQISDQEFDKLIRRQGTPR